MERDKSHRAKRKHRHSRHSKHDDSSSEDEDSISSSDYDLDSDESDSYSESSESSSGEERRRKARKKARRSSELEERKHKRVKKKSLKKPKKSKGKKSRKSSKIDIDEISMDDYFLRSAEFRTWLSKERGKFFSDLSSEQSRKLFGKFVSKWNSGDLDKTYYKGIQSSAVGHDSQSNYQWQFASGVKSSDLKTVRDSVSSWSSSKDNFDLDTHATESSSSRAKVQASSDPDLGPQPAMTSHTSSGNLGRIIGPSRGPIGQSDEDMFAREERRERESAHLKKDRKGFRKQQELVMDELLPKASGPKEARMEKKKMRAQMRRERDMSPDDNSKVYGKTTNTIRDKVVARQEYRQNRAQAAVQKISDYQARERAKAEAILQMAKANKKEGALW